MTKMANNGQKWAFTKTICLIWAKQCPLLPKSGIYKDNMPDLGNNGHCFAPKWYKMSQNYQPQQTRGLSMLVDWPDC